MSSEIDEKILGKKPKWFDWKKKTILILIVLIIMSFLIKYNLTEKINIYING